MELPVDRYGRVDPDQLEATLTDRTILVSIMLANHETGCLNDIAALAELCKARDIRFHTDATQAVGKVGVHVDTLNVDMLSLSAHKFYGPQGVGALYTRRKRPRIRLQPLFEGGGHERGIRSGTLNLPGIVGLGEAARVAAKLMPNESPRLAQLRDRLENQLLKALPHAQRNGHLERRLPHTTNLSLGYVDAERLIAAMPDLAVSSASACTTAAMQQSRILKRMNVSEARARASLRFGLGRGNTSDEIDAAIAIVIEAVRNYNPSETTCESRL
ncbi:MAG: cysteine desulfurase family protein [Phycisphaeraceae bacterium]